jgi:ethanolamine utilization cobalamin adenosyltransferase
MQRLLADIRAALGNVLRCETLGEAMPEITIGDFDQAQLHALSHNPLRHLGHDHIVPAIEHGLSVARLNLLRTVIREAEVAGAQAFIGSDYSVSRGDLLQALNRLSSAVYVLMLIVLNHEKSGKNS